MNTITERANNLLRLAGTDSLERQSETERFVNEHRAVIRQAIRKGHSLATISRTVGVGQRTLQKYLSKAGLFFRKPRKNKGTVIRPYKARKIVLASKGSSNV